MYCPSCGNDVSAGLSFCNQCGARLNPADDPRAVSAGSYNLMVAAVVAMPFIGLIVVMMVIAALKNGMNFPNDFIFAISFLTFLLFAIAEIGLIVMLLTRTKGPKRASSKAKSPITDRLAFDARRGLGSPTFEPVGSVTDHTTRTLDPALRKERDE